jgi:hypothetical protein
MSEAVCESCGTAYPYHVKRGCNGRHIPHRICRRLEGAEVDVFHLYSVGAGIVIVLIYVVFCDLADRWLERRRG